MIMVNKKSLIFQFLVFTALLVTLSTTSINLDPDNKLQKVFAQDEKETSLIKDKSILEKPNDDMVIVKEPNGEEQSPFVKDKSILEKPNDDMVIVEEPLPDEDFVESGDAYLTISTIFKGISDDNYRYVQNVGVCVGSELIVSNKEISAVPACANHSENGVKYTVQAPGKIYVYLSYLLENYAMDLGSSSCENRIFPGESQSCTLTVTLKPLPFK